VSRGGPRATRAFKCFSQFQISAGAVDEICNLFPRLALLLGGNAIPERGRVLELFLTVTKRAPGQREEKRPVSCRSGQLSREPQAVRSAGERVARVLT
jgi:hypothetical protein